MQHENILEGLLRLQLSSDAVSALYLPSVLSTLSSIHFSTSTDSQIHKWATRVISLMQSKDASARWAGACLAKKTAELRSELGVEYAQRWINLTLPLLSVRSIEPLRSCILGIFSETSPESGTSSSLESVNRLTDVSFRDYNSSSRVQKTIINAYRPKIQRSALGITGQG
jgi:hypothetical protein